MSSRACKASLLTALILVSGDAKICEMHKSFDACNSGCNVEIEELPHVELLQADFYRIQHGTPALAKEQPVRKQEVDKVDNHRSDSAHAGKDHSDSMSNLSTKTDSLLSYFGYQRMSADEWRKLEAAKAHSLLSYLGYRRIHGRSVSSLWAERANPESSIAGAIVVAAIVVITVAAGLVYFSISGSASIGGETDALPGRTPTCQPTQDGSAQQLLQAPRVPQPDVASSGPPPICPSLILPHTEARFMVPVESLMRASGELDVRGTSGRKLLSGSVTEESDGRRRLKLASCGCEDEPRITVIAPNRVFAQGPLAGDATATNNGGTLEIVGRGGMPYGTLEASHGSGFVLKCNGQPVMSLEAGVEDLCMTAISNDGRLLASGGKIVQVGRIRVESHDAWKLQVKPGIDAILISGCMLGVLLFGQ